MSRRAEGLSEHHQRCHDSSDITHDPPLHLCVLGPGPHISARHVRSNYSRRLQAGADNPAGTNPTRCPPSTQHPAGPLPDRCWTSQLDADEPLISIVMNIWTLLG